MKDIFLENERDLMLMSGDSRHTCDKFIYVEPKVILNKLVE